MQSYLARSSSLVNPPTPCVVCVDAIFLAILQNWLIVQTLSSYSVFLFHAIQLLVLALELAFSTALSISSESRSCPSGQERRARGQLLS